jgi:hypothetical protein
MQQVGITLDCDVMFNDEGEVEAYVYLGDTDAPVVFSFNLTDILTSNVEMYTVPDIRHINKPYIREDDMEAHFAISSLTETLKEGAEYIQRLKSEYLDNEPNHGKDIDV